MDKELLLYNYFSKQLTADQQKLFEDLLKSDSDFKKQFDFEKDVKEVILNQETVKLKNKLVGFEKEISKDKSVRKLPRSIYQKWAMAASIALLMGLGWLGYTNFAGPNYNDLYQENFQGYPNTVYTITRSDSDQTRERDAFVAYESGDFKGAADGFKTISKNSPTNYLDFYLGMSYLQLHQLKQAKTYFTNTINGKSNFVDEANWYMALIAIKEENKATAKQYLMQLTAADSYNQAKAKQLLEKLD
ncbi:hypothetical protein LCGC14_1852340 [marine sediment metagenome]|uniref:Tetratricopeptide repeat-containing protein n=2 Tax=root TaxID=1 RepID=A0A831QND2_9FLAO|nr:hypothetical protein [Pricia antarctica]